MWICMNAIILTYKKAISVITDSNELLSTFDII